MLITANIDSDLGVVVFVGLASVIVGYIVRDQRHTRQASEKSFRQLEAKEHLRWSRAGFNFEEEQQWSRFPGLFTPEEALEFRKQGISPEKAHNDSYEAAWATPSFDHPGFTPEEAKLWRDAGYSIGEARRLSEKHKTPPPRKR